MGLGNAIYPPTSPSTDPFDEYESTILQDIAQFIESAGIQIVDWHHVTRHQ